MLKLTRLDVSSHPSFDGHEEVVLFENPDLGLEAIIAVHNTNLGPSLGGCRVYPYASREDAITDVLRLSKGMTYKSALAGLPLGGGKSVIIGDPKKVKSAAFMECFGEAIESMGGKYIVAEDVGSNEEDMIAIARKTSYVAGLPAEIGAEGVAGNPSPVTAFGVYCGIKSCVDHLHGAPSLAGKSVAIQGLGAVGYALAQYLVRDGASLIVADVNIAAVERAKAEFGDKVQVVDVTAIHAVDADIFAPCALGAGLNDKTIPEIKARIIGGAANNQLAEKRHDVMLKEKGILYAPDYAINSGGITSVGYEYFWRTGRNPYHYPLTVDTMNTHVARIAETLKQVFILAENKGVGTGEAADQLAERNFRSTSTTVTSAA